MKILTNLIIKIKKTIISSKIITNLIIKLIHKLNFKELLQVVPKDNLEKIDLI